MPARLPGLDLLRAIAIVWVMLFHSWLIGGLGPDWNWLTRNGWIGVDLFFVLSGFLIGRQLLAPLARAQGLDWGGFYLRRALRVLPAYVVVLAVYLLSPVVRERPEMAPWWAFVSFTYNFVADASAPAFSQVWSLCVEEHFYLVFPALAWLLVPRLRPRGFVLLCVGLVIAGIVLRGGIWLADTRADAAGALPRNWFVEDIYYPTWCRLDGLLAGVVLAAVQVFRPAWWAHGQSRANLVLAFGIVVLALALWLVQARTGLLANTLGWPVLSLGMVLLVFAGAGRSSLIGARALPGAGWLAATSYSLYLTHKIAYGLVYRHLAERLAGHPLFAFGAYAVTILVLGALLHYLVERPGLQLRQRWLRRPMPVTANA